MDSTETRLKQLFRDGVDGDRSSYRTFLTELGIVLRRYVRRQLGKIGCPEHDAEDIVQDALIAIHEKRHTYDGETPVTAWAHAIARYKLIDSLRASRRGITHLPLDDVPDVPDDRQRPHAGVVARRLLAMLPPGLRVPLEMVKVQGMTAADVAERTGLAEATVRVNVHRGLNALARACGIDRRAGDGN